MLALVIASLMATAADTLSLEQLRVMSAELLRVDTVAFDGRIAYAQSITVPSGDHPLANFARDNRSLLTYLTQHGTSIKLTPTLDGARNDQERLEWYRKALLADEGFANVYLPLVAAYLRAQGAVIPSVPSSGSRLLRRSEVMRVAVRFFSPFLAPSGFVGTYVCTAFNDVRELTGPRDLVLEALAYAAIIAEMQPSRPPAFDEDFRAARRLMNSLELSPDTGQRLERARGVMWGIMGQSAALAQVLDEAYLQRSTYLPFGFSDEAAPVSPRRPN